MGMSESHDARRLELRVKRIRPAAELPGYAHPGDAGLDLHAAVEATIDPGAWQVVPTGISIELPQGTEGQVRPRSGLATRHGVTVLNTPGTIDAGYRGEVGVILINHGREPFHVSPGMRIAQLVVSRCLTVEVVEATVLTDTSRGSGGFGSTGQ